MWSWIPTREAWEETFTYRGREEGSDGGNGFLTGSGIISSVRIKKRRFQAVGGSSPTIVMLLGTRVLSRNSYSCGKLDNSTARSPEKPQIRSRWTKPNPRCCGRKCLVGERRIGRPGVGGPCGVLVGRRGGEKRRACLHPEGGYFPAGGFDFTWYRYRGLFAPLATPWDLRLPEDLGAVGGCGEERSQFPKGIT